MNALILAAVTLLNAAPSLESSAADSESARIDSTRVRFAISSVGTMDTEQSVPTVGLNGQLGVQLNDRWAVYGEVQASSLLFFYNCASAELMVERTFWDVVSIGTGVGYETSMRHTINFSGLGGTPDQYMSAVEIPLRVQLNLGPTPTGSSRHRFFVAVEGNVGFGTNNFGGDRSLGAALSLGYVLM